MKLLNQFWPWSPFRIFGPKEAVDFIITHSSSKEEYDNHKKNMIKALLAVDSTFTYKIFDSSNMQTVIDYSLHIGCENIIKSEDTAISVQNFSGIILEFNILQLVHLTEMNIGFTTNQSWIM